MKTRYEQMTAGGIDGYNNFTGDDSAYRNWLGVAGRSRDSGCLEESNFATTLKRLGGEGENVRVERFGHWAVGWIEEIYVRPGTNEATEAQKIHDELEEYPVLDEEDWSNRESEEANRVWADFSNRERVRYIREHRTEFDFRDLPDMLACAKGRYFAGYASELIS
jgi:hypothetical protein